MSTPKTPLLLAFIALLAFSGIALADRVIGTDGNEWSSDKHPNHPLPGDCGSKKAEGDLAGTPGNDVIRGKDGCDYIKGKEGADVIWGGMEMDFIYGGSGNDKIYGKKGHDHLFGGAGPGKPSGNDILDARDGNNEVGNIEEVHGAAGTDRCYLDSDPDGVKFSSCEFLNGQANPFGLGFVNTSDGGPKTQQERRAEVNDFLSR